MEQIQELLPKARVVYCSATGVSDTSNMAYMQRLGLWGAGSLYPTFSAFSTTLDKRGMGAMEMLAGHLKGSGMFVARTLSFEACSFELRDDIMTAQGEKIFDDAATFWVKLREELVKAREAGDHDPDYEAIGAAWDDYHSGAQRSDSEDSDDLCVSEDEDSDDSAGSFGGGRRQKQRRRKQARAGQAGRAKWKAHMQAKKKLTTIW